MDLTRDPEFTDVHQVPTQGTPAPTQGAGKRKQNLRGMGYEAGQRSLAPAPVGTEGSGLDEMDAPGEAGEVARESEGTMDVGLLGFEEQPAPVSTDDVSADALGFDELSVELAGPVEEARALEAEAAEVQKDLEEPLVAEVDPALEMLGSEFMPVDGGEGLMEAGGSVATSSKQLSTTTAAEHQTYLDSEQTAINEAVAVMTEDEKRLLLASFGYSQESIDSMSSEDVESALKGVLGQEFRFRRVMGMTLNQLTTLPYSERYLFLQGLGIPAEDMEQASERNINKAFDQVVRHAKRPGNHKVNLRISGNWFSGKSYDITFDVTQEGIQDIQIKQKGGLLQWLGGIIKKALPVIAMVLAPITFGLSTLALGVFNFIQGVRSGNWLNAILSLAGGIGTLTFSALQSVARIARAFSGITRSIQGVFTAFSARSPGGILAALASGAGAAVGIMGEGAEGFASTLEDWATRLETWSEYALGAEVFTAAVQGNDALGAVDAALSVATMASADASGGKETSLGNGLQVTQRYVDFAGIAHDAVRSKPPRYGSFVGAALEMVGELTGSGRLKAAGQLGSRVQHLQDMVLSGDPTEIAFALLEVAKGIENVHKGDPEAEGTWFSEFEAYEAPARSISKALKDRDWLAVANHASSVVAGLTEHGWVDEAASLTGHVDDLNGAVASGDPQGIFDAATGIWGIVDGALTRSGGSAPESDSIPGAPPSQTPGQDPAAASLVGLACAETRSCEPLRIAKARELTVIASTTGWRGGERAGASDKGAVVSELYRIPLPGLHQLQDLGVTVVTCINDVVDARPNLQGVSVRGHDAADSASAVIQGDDISWFRNKRSMEEDEPLGKLQDGLAVHIVGTDSDWTRIAINDPGHPDYGREGWVHRDNLRNKTWEDVPGAYYPGDRQVIIATRGGRVPPTGDGHGSDNLVIHEVGHAIGHELANSSTGEGYLDPAFIKARTADKDKLTAYEQQPALGIHNVSVGVEETYGESMARFLMGDPVDEIAFPELTEYWRNNPYFSSASSGQ